MTDEFEQQESSSEEAPEGGSEEARPDEDDVQDVSADEQDPEAGPAADQE